MDRSFDATLQAHHTFFMGDLNYRVEASSASEQDPDVDEKREAREEQKERFLRHVESQIASKDWSSLLALDQLTAQMAMGRVLSGFEAPVPDFAPTFKVERGKGARSYNTQRV